MSKFSTKYGYFSDDGSEYVITNYNTPKPWVNVISNGQYGLVISQTGGGFSWKEHSEFNRLNRWHQDLVQDNWGKFFYVKDNLSGEIWSPTWMPVKTQLNFFECRHGLGYTVFNSVYKDVEITLTIHVPLKEDFELWDFKIANIRSVPINLSIYTYFEWCLGSSADHHREFHKSFIETEFHDEFNTMLATKRLWEIPIENRGHWNIEYPYYGFISSTKKIADYDGEKETFIGRFNSVNNPAGLYAKQMAKKTGKWGDAIASLKSDLLINANEVDYVTFILGIQSDKSKIPSIVEKYSSRDNINASLNEIKSYWINFLSPLEVVTPDDALNILVNKWLRYQAISGRLWGRTAYYQQSGAYGFRDQLQDSLVFLPIDSSLTASQIRLHARHQFEDGTVLHWWHPITETGLSTKMTDDLLWLPFVVLQYIDETADYKFLFEKEPYYDNKLKEDTLLNHCIAAIEKALSRFSERGLPLIGAGDWNDGLSAVGLEMKGESIWLAEFIYLILNRFSELLNKIEEHNLSKKYSDKAESLRETFNKHAWDGQWFFRATKDNGEKIGSKECDEGKIYLNAQTWSVISNITSDERKETAMEAVSNYLMKDNGTLLLYPAYTKPDKYIGYLSRYAPGRRENGGVYTHAATWAIWAYALLKDKKNVWELFKKLCPIYNGMNPDKYCAEPYVTPGNIEGPDSPNYGMGGWTWYTGSAAWFQKVIVDWIIGVRATEKGLIIDPCFPAEWDRVKIKRTFRGSVYNIEIMNKSNIKKIFVNGKEIDGNIISFTEENKEVQVLVQI
ncbi:GH36-type glycosyl hydrolase domain-containing protein [Melioribacteraceae bacterium 4301-Me]|uniref:GH36-type glycosyl hydrolase domain-containing protein n=1 Tax=Pyranulibacter aquaticus TaxID=3163344 RepID=UPI00359923FB